MRFGLLNLNRALEYRPWFFSEENHLFIGFIVLVTKAAACDFL